MRYPRKVAAEPSSFVAPSRSPMTREQHPYPGDEAAGRPVRCRPHGAAGGSKAKKRPFSRGRTGGGRRIPAAPAFATSVTLALLFRGQREARTGAFRQLCARTTGPIGRRSVRLPAVLAQDAVQLVLEGLHARTELHGLSALLSLIRRRCSRLLCHLLRRPSRCGGSGRQAHPRLTEPGTAAEANDRCGGLPVHPE